MPYYPVPEKNNSIGAFTALDRPMRSIARSLIRQFGASVEIIQSSTGYYDISSGRSVETEEAVPLSAKAIVSNYDDREIQAGLVKVGDIKILLASSSIDFELTNKDRILHRGIYYNIININLVYSGNQPCLIEIQGRK
jgi:hypothetical protein